MKINAKNLGSGRTLVVEGTSVPIAFVDRGQTAVLATLTIEDTDIEHPNSDGTPVKTTKRLDAGTYECALTMAVVRTDAGGIAYDSELSIAGVPIAGIRGSLPDGKKIDRGILSFTLEVIGAA